MASDALEELKLVGQAMLKKAELARLRGEDRERQEEAERRRIGLLEQAEPAPTSEPALTRSQKRRRARRRAKERLSAPAAAPEALRQAQWRALARRTGRDPGVEFRSDEEYELRRDDGSTTSGCWAVCAASRRAVMSE